MKIPNFETFLNESVIPHFENDELDLKGLYDEINDNYKSNLMNYMKLYDDNKMLTIPVLSENKMLYTIIVEFHKYKNFELGAGLVLKLQSANEIRTNKLLNVIDELYQSQELGNKGCLWILDKVIEILGKKAAINKK